jgi:signal transduction histidine kinase
VENTIDSSAYDGVPLQDILDPLEGHAEIEYECDPESQVYAEESLSIVANTLLQNTLDHSGSQEPKLYVEVEDDGEAYYIDIWDDGNGMPAHADEDEIFYRGEGDGSGLGLYLAREITELFGGTLKYSEENASREDGFGLQWKLNKPEDQDSGEVMSGDRYCAT